MEEVLVFKSKGKSYNIYNRNLIIKKVQERFSKNINSGMNKYPALKDALSIIPSPLVFVDYSCPVKKAKAFLKAALHNDGILHNFVQKCTGDNWLKWLKFLRN